MKKQTNQLTTKQRNRETKKQGKRHTSTQATLSAVLAPAPSKPDSRPIAGQTRLCERPGIAAAASSASSSSLKYLQSSSLFGTDLPSAVAFAPHHFAILLRLSMLLLMITLMIVMAHHCSIA